MKDRDREIEHMSQLILMLLTHFSNSLLGRLDGLQTAQWEENEKKILREKKKTR